MTDAAVLNNTLKRIQGGRESIAGLSAGEDCLTALDKEFGIRLDCAADALGKVGKGRP